MHLEKLVEDVVATARNMFRRLITQAEVLSPSGIYIPAAMPSFKACHSAMTMRGVTQRNHTG